MANRGDDNIVRFHTSLARELDAVKDRVRLLIGSSNWGEEGRYKEILLRNFIQKYLPYPYRVATGFVKAKNGLQSKQIDILIYNNMLPTYFNERDFVIVSERSLSAFIEVKTKVNSISSIDNAISHISEPFYYNINNNNNIVSDRIFSGLFFYDNNLNIEEDTEQLERVKDMLSKSKAIFNHIVLGTQYFIKFWPDDNEYKIYKLLELSYTYFMSNLLDSLIRLSGQSIHEQYQFRYPEPGGKEGRVIAKVSLT